MMGEQFNKTKKVYMAAMPNVNFPITYTEWMELPDNLKEAALFVNFMPVIINIVSKNNTQFTCEEDMISAITYALTTSAVNNIKGHPEKFTNAYMGTVIDHAIIYYFRRLYFPTRFNSDNISNIQVDENNHEYDIFETLIDSDDFGKKSALSKVEQIINSHIAELDPDTMSLINGLLKKNKIPAYIRNKAPEIMADLRKLLAEPASYFTDITVDCETFEDVIICEDLIESATVVMSDGKLAVYVGEKRIKRYRSIEYVFMGEDQDYIVPRNIARDLKVVSIETL